MQTATTSSRVSGASDGAILAQVAALRESLQRHRGRALKLWEAWAPEADDLASGRPALGKHTQGVLKREEDLDCG